MTRAGPSVDSTGCRVGEAAVPAPRGDRNALDPKAPRRYTSGLLYVFQAGRALPRTRAKSDKSSDDEGHARSWPTSTARPSQAGNQQLIN